MKMSENIITPKWLSLLPALALLWLVIGCFLAFQLWPDLPHTKLQWFLFIVFGPPIYILGEAFFGWLFSPDRVLLALPIVLSLFALSWWVSWLLAQ